MTQIQHGLLPRLKTRIPTEGWLTGGDDWLVPDIYTRSALTFEKYNEKIKELEMLPATRARVKHLIRYKEKRSRAFDGRKYD